MISKDLSDVIITTACKSCGDVMRECDCRTTDLTQRLAASEARVRKLEEALRQVIKYSEKNPMHNLTQMQKFIAEETLAERTIDQLQDSGVQLQSTEGDSGDE